MAIEYNVLYKKILEGFPDSKIELVDLVGDNNHYDVKITSKQFNGLSSIDQSRLVHKILKDCLGKDLHALSIKTFQIK